MPLIRRGRVWRGIGPAHPDNQSKKPESPMFSRILMASLCVASLGLASLPADAAKPNIRRDLSKEFKDLTPSEQIAIRAAAKAAYKAKNLEKLVVCADPGNMPYSNIRLEGMENKIAQVLGD